MAPCARACAYLTQLLILYHVVIARVVVALGGGSACGKVRHMPARAPDPLHSAMTRLVRRECPHRTGWTDGWITGLVGLGYLIGIALVAAAGVVRFG